MCTLELSERLPRLVPLTSYLALLELALATSSYLSDIFDVLLFTWREPPALAFARG